jgi:xanthosine utilization system XapX-like protein
VAGNLPAGTNFATVDNLYFAVPAPGAIALLGVAGLVSGARKRR